VQLATQDVVKELRREHGAGSIDASNATRNLRARDAFQVHKTNHACQVHARGRFVLVSHRPHLRVHGFVKHTLVVDVQ
jgi:hypothetical protein